MPLCPVADVASRLGCHWGPRNVDVVGDAELGGRVGELRVERTRREGESQICDRCEGDNSNQLKANRGCGVELGAHVAVTMR